MEENTELLQKIERLTAENNKILKGIRRQNRWAGIWRLLKWIVIIGLTVYSYYYLEPFIKQAQEMYSDLQSTKEDIVNLKDQAKDIIDTKDKLDGSINNVLDLFKQEG